MEKDIILYKTDDGKITLDVNLNDETVWLNQKQMGKLFNKARNTITEHINNIFTEGELEKNSVCRKFRHTAKDGKTYQTLFYNLDVIISVGYRVKSHRGTQFRIWSTNVLRNHLIKGYTINEKRLRIQNEKLTELQNTIKILNRTIENQKVELDDAKGLLKIISEYTYALDLLDDYDHQEVKIDKTNIKKVKKLDYEEAMSIVKSMKEDFHGNVFGKEKDESFKSSLRNIYQTAFGEELYPSLEEKASNLLYFIVKNHSFVDGNKRIAAAVFIYFLRKNNILYKEDGSKRLADNALVAITLMIAESKPPEKDIIVKVLVNLINENN